MRFRLHTVIHSGERSTVFSATDRETGERLALKASRNAHRELAGLMSCRRCDPTLVARPAVGRVIEPYEIDARGGDLRAPREPTIALQLHDRADARPPRCINDFFAAGAMRPYFQSVAELHLRSGLDAHCDVKFENFVRPAGSEPGKRCLVDLEFAAHQGEPRRREFRKGTPLFMAPEMLIHRTVHPSMDSWALGIMLWQACCAWDGSHPLVGEPGMGYDALFSAMLEYAYDKSQWRNTAAPRASDLARLLLRKEPDERMPVCQALRHPLFSATR